MYQHYLALCPGFHRGAAFSRAFFGDGTLVPSFYDTGVYQHQMALSPVLFAASGAALYQSVSFFRSVSQPAV